MKLIEPTMEYDRQIQAFRLEYLQSGDSMDGSGHLRRFDKTRDWLDQLESTSSQYIYVRETDNAIVGLLQLRHFLGSDFLKKYAGHIGYCVRPCERQKGYATQMLFEALPECRRLGIDDVLITCLDDNEGSRRTILKNGGVYESKVFEPESQRWIERYWIHLP